MTELERALSTIALALGIDIEIKGQQEAVKQVKGYDQRAIEILNGILNTKYKHTTPVTMGMLKQLREHGFTLNDIEAVIKKKHSEWSSDPKMSKFLRPATLFQVAKFENYLQEAHAVKVDKMYGLFTKDSWE